MNRMSFSYSDDERKEITGSDAGVGDEMTPEDREGSATAFTAAAIGTKKRNRLTSR